MDFGEVSQGSSPGVRVTLTNKRDVPMSYFITVGAFDAGGEQIAEDNSAGALLGPKATQVQAAFRQVASSIEDATFKVTGVKSEPFSPVICGQ